MASLCRNKRIELDLTENEIANRSHISKDEYITFEACGTNIGELSILNTLKSLFGADLSKISAYISGFILDSLEPEEKLYFLRNLGYADDEICLLEKLYMNNPTVAKELGRMVLASENKEDIKLVDILYKSSVDLFPSLYKKKED